jgi:hypothetical protein
MDQPSSVDLTAIRSSMQAHYCLHDTWMLGKRRMPMMLQAILYVLNIGHVLQHPYAND